MSEKLTGNSVKILTFLMAQEDKQKLWDLTPHKEKRSLNSNAYFHVLADKLRQKLHLSMAEMKNQLISDYGQVEMIEGEPLIYKSNAPEEYMKKLEYIHTKCIKITEENGKKVYFYKVFRGSSTYSVQEMQLLIDGTVQECKQQDIPTATPDEIAKMQALWGNAVERKNKND